MRRLVAAVAWDRLRRRTLRIGIAEIIRTVRSVAPAAMTPAPAMPKTILAVALLVTVLPVALIGVRGGVWLRLAAAGNEGWQCVRVRDGDIAALNRRLRIRLLLRLMLRAVLLLIARRKRLRVARQIGLRLRRWRLRREARLVLAHERLAVVAVVVVVVVVGRALRSALARLR